MPIPSTSITHCEILMVGGTPSAGSDAKNIIFVFDFRRNGTVNPVNKVQIEAAFQAAIAVPILAALNADYVQVHNSVRFLNDALDAFQAVSRAVAGSIAGDRMGTLDAAFILLRTGLRGKSYRGGKHLGPMSESDTTTGTSDIFNAGCLARLATAAAAILGGFTDSNGNIWTPSVVSRKLSQLRVNPTNVVANDVVSTAVNKRVGSMNHRKVKSVY